MFSPPQSLFFLLTSPQPLQTNLCSLDHHPTTQHRSTHSYPRCLITHSTLPTMARIKSRHVTPSITNNHTSSDVGSPSNASTEYSEWTGLDSDDGEEEKEELEEKTLGVVDTGSGAQEESNANEESRKHARIPAPNNTKLQHNKMGLTASKKPTNPKPKDVKAAKKPTTARPHPKARRSWYKVIAAQSILLLLAFCIYTMGFTIGKQEGKAGCDVCNKPVDDRNVSCSECFKEWKSCKQLFKQCMDNTDNLCWYRKMEVAK